MNKIDRTKLINDINFRNKCCVYGLDWKNFNIFDDIIVLNTPKNDVFVILDEKYNTIGILNTEEEKEIKSIQEYVLEYKRMYDLVDSKTGFTFPYPFQKLSLKQIVELADNIFIVKNYLYVNNNKYDIYAKDNIIISLLLYVKFIGEQINNYFLNSYQMKILGFKYPDVHSYIKSLIANINESINTNIKNENYPLPIDIMEYLGQNREVAEKYDIELYGIINVLVKNNKNLDDEILKIINIIKEEDKHFKPLFDGSPIVNVLKLKKN